VSVMKPELLMAPKDAIALAQELQNLSVYDAAMRLLRLQSEWQQDGMRLIANDVIQRHTKHEQ
jgi:hypothetical protein